MIQSLKYILLLALIINTSPTILAEYECVGIEEPDEVEERPRNDKKDADKNDPKDGPVKPKTDTKQKPKPKAKKPLPPKPERPVETLLAELAHKSHAVRDKAMTDLMTHTKLNDRHLSKVLSNPKSAEQKHRLIKVALHRFYATIKLAEIGEEDKKKGALGVYFPSVKQRVNIVHPHQYSALKKPAMMITHTYPGFPAYVHLRAGDMIIGMDNKLFPDDLDHEIFSDRIKVHQAGEPFTIQLIRNGKSMSVTLSLARRSRLVALSDEMASVPHPQAYGPWKRYLKKLMGDKSAEKPIRIDPDKNADDPDRDNPSKDD